MMIRIYFAATDDDGTTVVSRSTSNWIFAREFLIDYSCEKTGFAFKTATLSNENGTTLTLSYKEIRKLLNFPVTH